MNDLQIKEYAFKRAEMIENYIACYIKQTGLKADEIILVEKRSDDGLRIEWYCEPKSHLTQRAGDVCHVCGAKLPALTQICVVCGTRA